MRLSEIRPGRRAGFTLVEILMVIAIIGLLVGILVVALGPILKKGPEMTVHSDINQFGIALQSFHSDFGFFPPSRVRLYRNATTYNTDSSALARDSRATIGRMFPRMTWVNVAWTQVAMPPAPASNPDPAIDLEGDQCLVFFLGGIQSGAAGTFAVNGFGTNPTTPTVIAAGATTKGPYFEFRSNRLIQHPRASGNVYSNVFLSYSDGIRLTPFAYFSSYARRNGYNQYFSMSGTSDCPSLPAWPSGAVFPYEISAGSFHNPNTYQIISAGSDEVFGVGSQYKLVSSAATFTGYRWTQDTVANVPRNANLTGDGQDDMSNFNYSLMGKQ